MDAQLPCSTCEQLTDDKGFFLFALAYRNSIDFPAAHRLLPVAGAALPFAHSNAMV